MVTDRIMGSDSEAKNPLLAVDTIIRLERQIILVERKNEPSGWALPGGFVETGETVEAAARRETREETNLELDRLQQWRVFSDPARDPRRHVVSVVFTAEGSGTLNAATDAASAKAFSLQSPLPELAFDHSSIIRQYRQDLFKPSRLRSLTP